MQIVLLRGINVGAHNKLVMAEFTEILTGLGAQDVKTYIQSGNAVIKGEIDGEVIATAINTAKGFKPEVLVIPLATVFRYSQSKPIP